MLSGAGKATISSQNSRVHEVPASGPAMDTLAID
jgi:hypothetical protein